MPRWTTSSTGRASPTLSAARSWATRRRDCLGSRRSGRAGNSGLRALGRCAVFLLAARAGDRQLSPLREHSPALFGSGRSGEEIALHLVAAVQAQKGELGFGLDALGDDVQPEVLRKVDDRAGQRRVVGVGRYVADERAVDLEGVDGEALEVAQARIAGAEVVHGQLDSGVKLSMD